MLIGNLIPVNTEKLSCSVISAWNGVKLANALAAVVCSTCSLIDLKGGGRGRKRLGINSKKYKAGLSELIFSGTHRGPTCHQTKGP